MNNYHLQTESEGCMNQLYAHQLEELAKLNQLKDDFLSTVSHELRSPLTNIKIAIKLLKIQLEQDEKKEIADSDAGDLSQIYSGERNGNTKFMNPIEEQAIFKTKIDRYLLILDDECDRQMNLLNNFLDIQQLDAKNYMFNQTEICLPDLIPQIIEPFLKRMRNKQQTFQLEMAANLPIISIDQTSLKRILQELLTNASKFTPSGGAINVMLAWESKYTEFTNLLQLKVTNSGVEIPTKFYSQIFAPFYRIPNCDRWKYNGTGLGLTLVKKLTEYLGGSILVESGAGQTCFTLAIPIDA